MFVFYDLSNEIVVATHVVSEGGYERIIDRKALDSDQSELTSVSIDDLINIGDFKDILDNRIRIRNIDIELPSYAFATEYLKYDESLNSFEVVSREALDITTDATDSYQPYDGVPDIEANGTSSCTIFFKKKDSDGNYLTGDDDDDQIDVECSRGLLSAIRVNLVSGEAQVTLISAPETCVSNLVATMGGSCRGEIKIQFAPVS